MARISYNRRAQSLQFYRARSGLHRTATETEVNDDIVNDIDDVDDDNDERGTHSAACIASNSSAINQNKGTHLT